MPSTSASHLTRRIAAGPFLALVVAMALTQWAPGAVGQYQEGLPAFPGAEGFGTSAVGGRGGQVLEVTNLQSAGPGSLRAAIDAKGPRVVVFRVAGTIELDSSLVVRYPYITIAGQTAPGDGITLRNSRRSAKTPLKVETHDVIVRYIRSRPGSNPNETGTLDAITISSKVQDVYNVVIDHSSFSWATDEVTNIYYAAHDITIQWSIIAEGLDCSTHIEEGKSQCHSMGMLLGSEHSKKLSIHHNLFAHNRHRNPKVKTGGLVDVVNNVVYNSGTGNNWRSPSYFNGEDVQFSVNYVSNIFKPGPDSGSAEWFIDTKGVVAVYLHGNVAPRAILNPDPEDQANIVTARHPAPAVTTTSAERAFELVLEDVGANLGLDCDGTAYRRRDAVDGRIVDDVRTGAGRIISEPEQVGGWPTLAPGIPCPDGDKDGMPDEWEALMGLNPADPSDGARLAAGGYTWLETFLNPASLTRRSTWDRSPRSPVARRVP